jgi:fructose 1,6-bisphosphatase
MHLANMLRRMDESEPASLEPEEIKRASLHEVLEKLKNRFKPAQSAIKQAS